MPFPVNARKKSRQMSLKLHWDYLFGRLDLLDKDVAVLDRTRIHLAEVIAIYKDMLLKPDNCRFHA